MKWRLDGSVKAVSTGRGCDLGKRQGKAFHPQVINSLTVGWIPAQPRRPEISEGSGGGRVEDCIAVEYHVVPVFAQVAASANALTGIMSGRIRGNHRQRSGIQMPQDTIFERHEAPSVPIANDERLFPVHRIFCVGRNYAAHAAEMGHEVDREAPFYFTKSAQALVLAGGTIPYPPGTADCHHEMEFVVAIGASAFQATVDRAMDAVFGYACGIDLTRRDLQAAAKEKRRPWDLGKDFENSAIVAPLSPAVDFGEIGNQSIVLVHNGETVQQARLSDMVWSVPELIANLSQYYRLQPGDLIFTGTPAGVGPVQPGSVLQGEIEGLAPLRFTVGEKE